MGRLTVADLKERVKLVLYNRSSTHPIFAADMDITAINTGVNNMIREFPEMFTEHNNRSFTFGPTEVDANRIPMPGEILIAYDKLYTNEDSDDPTIDPADPLSDVAYTWAKILETPVTPAKNPQVIGMLDKTEEDYPRMWVRKATDILYWPTTATGFTCFFRQYGVSREGWQDAPGATFRIHEDFDEAHVEYSAGSLARSIGWEDRALELENDARARIARGVNVKGREQMARRQTVTFAGAPRG